MSDSNPAATGGSTNNPPDHVLTISGSAFAPARLQVTPGATVTVRNLDSMPHSVTSEATMNDFRPGAVAGISFDTGPFMGETTFTIPATAAVGTVVPFFSTTGTSMMMPATGEIEIVAATSMPTPTMPMTPM
jgi:plastocyanin